MLVVITPATSFDLTTLDAAKAELGISLINTEDDDRITSYIAQASKMIAGYCNRVFAKETVAEAFRLDQCRDLLILARYPIANIESITENGVSLATSDYEIEGDNGALQRLQSDVAVCWTFSKIVVTYDAGYILPGAPGRNLPEDIERAALMIVSHYYRDGSRDPAIRRETVDGIGSVDFHAPANGMPPGAEAILERYRAPAIG